MGTGRPLTRADVAWVVAPPVVVVAVFILIPLLVEPGAWAHLPPSSEYLFKGLLAAVLLAWGLGLARIARKVLRPKS